MQKNKRVLRSKVKVIILVIVLLAVIGLITFLIIHSSGGQVEFGSFELRKPDEEIIIIRDESLIMSSEYGKINFFVDEGQIVAKDTDIAYVYKLGFYENTLQSLLTTRQEIRKYQLAKKEDVVDRTLEDMDTAIKDKVLEVADCINKKNELDLLVLERELKELQKQRYEYLKTHVQPDLELSDLYNKEQMDLSLLNESIMPIKAKENGAVSFYFDGYEALFNAKKLFGDETGAITVSDIQSLKKGSTNKTTSTDSERALYRMINNDVWYVVITAGLDESNPEPYLLDEEYNIHLDGFYDKSYVGKVVGKNVLKKDAMYILEVKDNVREIINTRFAKATITKSIQGLTIPVDAIVVQDNKQGINIRRNNEKVFVEITVLFKNNKLVVFKCDDQTIGEGTMFVY